MAITLQTATLSAEFSYISLYDEAMDTESKGFPEAFEKYREGAIDMPPLKEGIEPTIWTLKPPASAKLKGMMDDVMMKHGQKTWAITYAAFCIKGVTGLDDEDGSPLELKFVRHLGYEMLCEEHTNLIGAEILREIGSRVIKHTQPSKT